MNTDPTFGQIVRERRLANNLTQVELANRVGCATVTIRKIEYDTLRPSVQIAERLAMALNIPLEDRANFVRLARVPLDGTPEPAPIPSPPPMPEEIGQEDLSGRAVKGYKLGERIGSGGFGAVYRAVQDVVEREVAVKIILPQYANHPDFIRRFESEAQIIARIEHPFIVPLYDYWREPSAAYLVMRLLRGGSLEQVLKGGALPLKTAVRYVEQIGMALHSAHRVGIIHRDIKPANILLDNEDNSFLADFGIAKNLGNPNAAEQTAAGMMIGSPAYISPEQILAEPVRPQADIYCLGLLLYEMLTGRKPFSGPTPIDYIQQHLNQKLPPLNVDGLSYPPGLEAIIDRATTKKAAERYPDVLSMLAEIQTVLSRWENGSSASTIDVTELIAAENPYKGLYAFGEGDAENFFGREIMVQELLSRLADSDVPDEGAGRGLSRFLAIVGPSGSGKSSVVKAGLLPALRDGGVPSSENWFIVDMTPGTHPFEEVEAALLRIATNPPDSLLGQLREDTRGLLRASKRILPQDGLTELLLVIDQFEELFTLVEDEQVRSQFLDSLVNAVIDSRSRVRVIITLRADFIDRPLQYVDFGELVRKRSEFMLPLSPDELEQAITQPLTRFGMGVEPELLATMIHEISGQPGGLPLLQYALTELFERREGRLLTLSAYQAIDGVGGALAQRADEIYEALSDDGRAATRQLFLRLITLGEGISENLAAADTRRRVRLSELTDLGETVVIQHTIEQFGRYRLLTFDHDPVTRESTAEVAHEALLREWGRLREWLNESRDDVRRQRLLAAAAAEWVATHKDRGYLLRGSRLAQFEEWANRSKLVLTTDERAFLADSIAAEAERKVEEEARQQRELKTAQQLAEEQTRRAEEQAAAAQSLRQRAYFLVGALVIAAVLAAAAFGFARSSTNNANLAATQAAESLLNANLAATSEADALLNAELAVTREAEAQAGEQAAVSAQATAQVEAAIRATAEAEAFAQRDVAQTQTNLAVSRELSQAANGLLDTDPELSMLLSLEALETAYTINAEDVLHTAIQTSRVHKTLLVSNDTVWGVRYTPDGTKLLTAATDGTVQLWDTATWKRLAALEEMSLFRYYAFEFNDLGNLFNVVAQGINGEGLRLVTWDLDTFEATLVQTFDVDAHELTEAALSPDNTLLVVGTVDNQAELWDVISGERLFILEGFSDIPWEYSFSRDGTRLAIGSRDRQVVVLDIPASLDFGSPQVLTSFVSPQDTTLISIQFGSTNDLVAIGVEAPTVAEVWDISDLDSPQIMQLALETSGVSKFNTKGDLIVEANFSGSLIKVWDVNNGQTLFTLVGHTSFVNDAVFSPDERYIATASNDGTVHIWNASRWDGGELQTFYSGPGIMSLEMSPDEKFIARGNYFGSPAILDRQTLEVIHWLEGSNEGVYRVTFHPNGSQLAGVGIDNVIRIWDVNSGELLRSWKGHKNEGSSGGFFPGILDVSYSPDGKYLATAGADSVAKVWDAETGEELTKFEEHIVGLHGIDYSPDGTMVATSSDASESTVKVWAPLTGEEIYTLNVQNRAWAVEFSSDNTQLVTGGTGGWVTMWDMTTGEELYSLPSQLGTVSSIVFTPDGKQFITAGAFTRVWDVATGELVKTIAMIGDGGLAITADGRYLYSGGAEGIIRLFTLNLEDTITLAKERLTRELTVAECQQYLHVDVCPQR